MAKGSADAHFKGMNHGWKWHAGDNGEAECSENESDDGIKFDDCDEDDEADDGDEGRNQQKHAVGGDHY